MVLLVIIRHTSAMETIDPGKIFSLNPNYWTIREKKIGRSDNRIVVVHNFFENPLAVKEYAESLSYVNTIEGEVSGTPGFIHRIGNGITSLQEPIVQLVMHSFNASNDFRIGWDKNKYTFQSYDSLKSVRIMSLHPHVDNMKYAAVLSLNKDDEYMGDDNGTAFWRHNNTQEEYISSDLNYRAKRMVNRPPVYVKLDPSAHNFDEWTRYHIEQHHFNSLILYEGNMWHSPYFTATKWTTNRLTFNAFLD